MNSTRLKKFFKPPPPLPYDSKVIRETILSHDESVKLIESMQKDEQSQLQLQTHSKRQND